MWEISNSFQLISLLGAAALGCVYSLVYDIFRALRKKGFNSDFAVFLGDIIFFILISPVTFCFLLALTNGELRGYFFIALLSGFILTRFTISKIFIKLYTYIISAFLKFFAFSSKCSDIAISAILKLFAVISNFCKKNFMKFANCFKKLLKKR